MLSYEARQSRARPPRSAYELGPRRVGAGQSRTRSIFHRASSRSSLHDFDRPWQQPRARVLPRPARDAGDARVRRLLRDDARDATAEIDRIQVTNREMEELVLSTRDRAGEGAPHPDRDRRRRVPRSGRCRRGSQRAASARPARPRRSSSARSRRTASVGRRDGAEADQGPGRARRGARALAGAVPELSSSSPAPRAATSGRGSSGSASPTVTCCYRTRDAVAPRVPRDRRLPRRLARRRAGRRACSSRWRRGSRSSRRGSGRRRTSSSTARTAGSSTSRTSKGSSPGSLHVSGATRRARERVLDAGRATAEDELVRCARDRAGGRCSRASWSSGRDGRERARARGTAAPPSRWARLLAGGRADARAPRLLRPRRDPRARASARRGARSRSRSSPRGFRTRPSDFSLLYLGTTWLPRDLGPLLALARRRGDPARREPGRRRLPGLGGSADGQGQPCRSGGPCSPPTTSSTRASSRSARPTVPRRAARRRGRSSRTRSTSSGSSLPAIRRTRAGAPPRRRPDAGLPPRARLGPCAHSTTTHPGARLLVTGRLVVDPAPLVAELGLEARVELLGEYDQRDAPSVLRRAHVLLHTKMQGSVPDARARGDGVRAPVAYAASGGTVELVGDDGRGGSPAPRDLGAGGAAGARGDGGGGRPGARRTCRATPQRRGRARSSGLRSTDWLERHAALFAELCSGGRRAEVAPDAARRASRAWNEARVTSPRARAAPLLRPGGRACARSCALRSRGAGGSSRRSLRLEDPPTRSSAPRVRLARVRHVSAGSYSMRAPDRSARSDVLDLLAGRPERSRPEPEPLVEGADPFDERPPQEDRERDRAIPQIVRRRARPRSAPRTGPSRRRRATARPVRPSSAGSPANRRGDPFEEVGRVAAVVVRERDDVARERAERRRCARARGRVASGGAAPRARGARRGARRRGRRRSGRRRRRGSAGASAPRASRESVSRSVVRSTVATTRSKRRSRSAPATGAGYPQPAVATPLVSVVLAARDAEATVGEAVRAACSARRSGISSSSSSTTGRPMAPARSSPASPTRGSGSSATRRRSVSPAR